MDKYTIEIQLLSETILGNGESSNQTIDIDVLKDDYGIPYMKGKNLKGRLRMEAEAIVDRLGVEKGIIQSLFGKKFSDDMLNDSKLKFSDCTISPDIENNLIYAINNYEIEVCDVIEAFTDLRSFTSMENGVAKDTSLRKARVIRKGLKLYCDVYVDMKLNTKELGILSASVASLRNIGIMTSRGKGKVKCCLLEDSISNNSDKRDITMDAIKGLEKEVI